MTQNEIQNAWITLGTTKLGMQKSNMLSHPAHLEIIFFSTCSILQPYTMQLIIQIRIYGDTYPIQLITYFNTIRLQQYKRTSCPNIQCNS